MSAPYLRVETGGAPADEPAVHSCPHTEAFDQVCEALDLVDRPASAFLQFPFPELAALTGGMAPGDVWFVCAFSGNGKTSFLSSAIDAWYEAGKKVYVLPLETRPKTFRTTWACHRLGFHPGDVLSGKLAEHPNEVAMRRQIRAELECQVAGPQVQRVRIKGVTAINTARLAYAVAEAAEWGADVVIIDHIDHIAGGDGSNLYAESVAVNHAALDLAQDYGIVLLAASQLNNAAMAAGRDRLAQYGPPQPNHVFMGGHKRQIATGMIGLHRKLRDRADDEDVKSYKAAIQAARTGDVDVHTVLEPGIMAATAMKLRNYGQRENQRAYLGMQQGRVLSLPERDRYRTSYDATRRI
jgi:hypothetical protein